MNQSGIRFAPPARPHLEGTIMTATTDKPEADNLDDADVLRAILNADPLLSNAEAAWFAAAVSESGVRLGRETVGVGA